MTAQTFTARQDRLVRLLAPAAIDPAQFEHLKEPARALVRAADALLFAEDAVDNAAAGLRGILDSTEAAVAAARASGELLAVRRAVTGSPAGTAVGGLRGRSRGADRAYERLPRPA